VLANWVVAGGSEGRPTPSGTNVFTFNEHGRIESVVGLWT
jgi:hypothetical protein